MEVTGARGKAWKWSVCGWLLFATMILYMDRLVLTQQQGLIRKDFGIQGDNLAYALLDSAFSVAFACGALLAGWLADRWTVWLLYPLVVTLWSFVGGITSLVGVYGLLLSCRFFLGFFESGHWPCALKTTQRILPPAERTLGNGILQSGAAIGSVVTPLVILWMVGEGPDANWRPPFVFVGALGLIWALGWFVLMRRSDFDPVPLTPSQAPAPGGSWLDIYRDYRFWVLVLIVICINSTWHFFRVWMPVILEELHGFSSGDVQRYSVVYYVAADVGSLATGFFTLALARLGMTPHGSQIVVFGACSILALLSLTAILAPGEPLFLWVLPVVGFASLGLFPVMYSFQQELTMRNQGKVTGSLGFIVWMVMAGVRAIEGWMADAVKARGGEVVEQYAFGIILAGIMPLVALMLLLVFWRHGDAKAAT